MWGAGRAASERGDISRAKEKASVLRAQLKELERKFEDDIEAFERTIDIVWVRSLKVSAVSSKNDTCFSTGGEPAAVRAAGEAGIYSSDRRCSGCCDR